MFKMLMMGGLAALTLTLAAPEMTHALQMEQAESATLAQLTQATTPAALRSPGADDRLTDLAHRLMALVDGDATVTKAAPAPAQWVPVDDYSLALATPTQQVAP